jgi:hypothetical protein
MRGCRLDKKNPNKRNSLFLWCNDLEVSKSVLTILKENDVNFHKKINIITNSYDKNDNEEIQKKIQDKKKIAEKFIKIDCLNLSQWWFIRFEKAKKYIDENKKKPSKRSKDDNIRKLASWLDKQSEYFRKGRGMYGNIDIKKLWHDFITDDKYRLLFLDFETEWFMNFKLAKEYIDKNGKRPIKRDKDPTYKFLGGWLSIQVKNYKHLNFNMKNENIKKTWEQFVNDLNYYKFFINDDDIWKDNLKKLKQFYDNLSIDKKRKPLKSSSDTNEKSLGNWLCAQKKNYKNNERNMKSTKDNEIRKIWINLMKDNNYSKLF